MRRVNLTGMAEPDCLRQQRESGNNWDGLPGHCKREVRQSLETLQESLCIYCERPLSVSHVEHLQSQSAHDSNTLDWGNLSLSCENDFKSCGHQKGSKKLAILPQDFPLSYPYRVLADGTLEPRLPEADWEDMLTITNLNGDSPRDLNLKNARRSNFDALFEQLVAAPAPEPIQARAIAENFWRQRGYPSTAASTLEACGIEIPT